MSAPLASSLALSRRDSAALFRINRGARPCGGGWARRSGCAGGPFSFASRRRHTSCGRDWSSDVCSYDLVSCFITWFAVTKTTENTYYQAIYTPASYVWYFVKVFYPTHLAIRSGEPLAFPAWQTAVACILVVDRKSVV